MLNAAFAGCGRISDLHAPGYTGLDGARIYGVLDTDREKAEARAAEWGAEKVYGDYEELLADDNVNLVEILTPHFLHCSMTVQAARAGKHVSVQKPMAMNMDEAREMTAECKKAGVTLRVYENFVYYPPYVKARELIDAGEIGEVRSINIRMRAGIGDRAWQVPGESWIWRLNEEMCGGCPTMFDHGYHNYSLAMYLGGGVEKVHAMWEPMEIVPESGLFLNNPATVIWRHKNRHIHGILDVVMSPELKIDSEFYSDESRVEIAGTKGIIFVNRCTGQLQNRAPVELYRDGTTLSYEDIPGGWEQSFIAATRDLIRALENGKNALLTGETGMDVLEFALAAARSALSGETVMLSQPHTP